MKKWTPELLADVLKMRAEGMTFVAISERIGFSESNIRKRVKQLDVRDGRRKPVFWTLERDAKLIELYEAEAYSMAQIAALVDPTGKTTPSACGGRLRRLGKARPRKLKDEAHRIQASVERARRPKTPHPWESPTGGAKPPQEIALTRVEGIQPLNLRIFDPGFGGCRFPTGGEGENTTFCCLPRPDGKSYCVDHAKVAFRADVTPRKKRGLERLVRRLARAA